VSDPESQIKALPESFFCRHWPRNDDRLGFGPASTRRSGSPKKAVEILRPNRASLKVMLVHVLQPLGRRRRAQAILK
jgi:hypothetical protein